VPKKKAEKNQDTQQAQAAVVLGEVVGITTIAEEHQKILKALESSNHVTVDASKVERFTSPGAQLLLTTEISLLAAEGELHVKQPSDVVTNVMNELGLEEKMNQWSKTS